MLKIGKESFCLRVLALLVVTAFAAGPSIAAAKPIVRNVKLPVAAKLKLVSNGAAGTLGQTVSKFDVTVVQFWASWCVGCGEMMAELAKRSKEDPSIGYASVSIDEDLETAQRYFKSKPKEVRDAIPNALLDEAGDRIATPLKITTLPYVLVATRDGRVVESVAGHPNPKDLTAMIERARAKAGSAKK